MLLPRKNSVNDGNWAIHKIGTPEEVYRTVIEVVERKIIMSR